MLDAAVRAAREQRSTHEAAEAALVARDGQLAACPPPPPPY